MQLTPDDIREFKEAWRLSFGETISDAEAHACGARLLDLYLLIGRLSENRSETTNTTS
jgi:hypothetical protein